MVDFNTIFKDANRSISKDFGKSKAKESMDWYKGAVRSMLSANKNPSEFLERRSLEIGKMFLFVYDAKHKDTLPFFDMYPLVFPIERYPDGFLGLNLHYLPPLSRVSLLNALQKITNNDKYDDSTKLNVTYRLLKAYSRQFAGYENCLKRYLGIQVRSSFFYVKPTDWEKVAMLPLQKWSINTNRKYADKPPY